MVKMQKMQLLLYSGQFYLFIYGVLMKTVHYIYGSVILNLGVGKGMLVLFRQ